jgi:hypothetical protein
MAEMSSQPHWRTPSFFKMVIAPPTSMKCIKWRFVSLEMRDDKSPFCRDGVLWDVYGDLIREFITSFLGFRGKKNLEGALCGTWCSNKTSGSWTKFTCFIMFHAIFLRAKVAKA